MKMSRRFAMLGMLVLCAMTTAFVQRQPAMHRPASIRQKTSALHLSSWDDSPLQHNKLRTDLRIFLTQRAIQSFIFLLISCRDPHTVQWLENNYGFANLENYHGTGAFNLTEWSAWDSLLVDMLAKPKDVVVIRARRRGRGQGGWSKNNPYLEDRFVEFEIDIDPPSLVSRLVSVREQIAKEWIDDLDTFIVFNNQILTSYHDLQTSGRDMEECVDYDDPQECLETAELTAPYSERKNNAIYDRSAMMMLSNSIEFDERASSPHRKGNFDLMILLSTQESVHRVLREYRQSEEREVSFEWLREFYVSRVRDYFDGDQRYGRADDFLEELLMSSPTMKQVDDKVELVDPLRIAEDIIRTRSQVAEEWKDIVQTIPEEHMELRKLLLARQMMGYSEGAPESTETEATSSDREVGDFE